MSNLTNVSSSGSCWLYDDQFPEVWGDCCEDLSIVPKPIWVVFLLSVPIEAVLAGADVKADASGFEKKSNQTAIVFLLYNLLTLSLLAVQFDFGSCEASVEGVWECYQGLLFMFYNSTAALASMTLWMLIIMRKYYPQMYFVTRLVIAPKFMWRWFDKLNLRSGGTHATVERWHMISASTKLFWYNQVGIVIFLIFGGISHIIPMFFAYPFILWTMIFALVFSHSIRLGYAAKKSGSNFKSTYYNILVFYPVSLVTSLVFLALSPLSLLLKICGVHPMDRKETLPIDSDESGILQIFLKTEGGTLITLEVLRGDSTESLIPKTKENLGLAFDRKVFRFQFEGQFLDVDNGQTFESYGLNTGDVLNLFIEDEKVDLTVKLEDGTQLVVTLSAEMKIKDLKAALEEQTGIAVGNQWLLENGSAIAAGRVVRTLEDASLELYTRSLTLTADLGNGDTGQVIIAREAKAVELRKQLEALVGRSADMIVVTFKGKELSDSSNLHELGLRNGDKIAVEPEIIDVLFKLESGEDVTTSVKANSTILEIQTSLENLTGIDANDQWLLQDGSEVSSELLALDLQGTNLEVYTRMMTLNVNLTNGNTERVEIARDAMYSELREAVATLEGADAGSVHVLFNDVELNGTDSLHQQGLRNENYVDSQVDASSDEGEGDFFDDDEENEFASSAPMGGFRYSSLAQRGSASEAKKQRERKGGPRLLLDKKSKKKGKAKMKKPGSPQKKEPKREKDKDRTERRERVTGVAEATQQLAEAEEIRVELKEQQIELEYIPVAEQKELEKEVVEILDETEQTVAEDKKDRKKEAARERRRRIREYIKDVLRNFCMFDPNGKVIMFAAATTFLVFTFSANYGLLLYSGAPYLDTIVLDWNARSSILWFTCTADNFIDINAFGLVDFFGLAIGILAAIGEFIDFLVTI